MQLEKPDTPARLAIMGGTFDPIHYGHLVTAEAVRREFFIDRVIFMPTGKPPHKQKSDLSNVEQRYLMTVLATTNNPHFLVSRMEIDRKGTTYTIDTVKEIKRQHKGAEIFFITGADAVQQILTWHNSDELLTLCDFVAVSRPGVHTDILLGEINNLKANFASKVHFLEVPALAISSTDIRKRVSEGKTITYLLPDIVEKHIMKMGLYASRGADSYVQDITPDERVIAEKVKNVLSAERYKHTLGVLGEAEKLATVYGADVSKARLAALLHDYSKELSAQRKREMCKLYKIKTDDVMKAQIDLVHSFLSAAIAKHEFGVKDKQVLNAIKYHTTARKEMELLEKILYVADMTEPTRESYAGLEEIRELAATDLDGAVIAGLKSKIYFTKSKNKIVHPLSVDALEYYESLREDN